MKTPRIICADCHKDLARFARGVCQVCYRKRVANGTRDELPRRSNGGRRSLGRADNDYDPAIVERVLGGEWRLGATPPERAEICRRWVGRGRSLSELARITGWKPERYYRIKDAA